MKKILFLMPLMATTLLVNCGGKNDSVYSIDVSASACSVEGLKDTYHLNDEAVLKFTANDEALLPNNLKVKIGDRILTKDTDYEYVLDSTFTHADFKIKVTDNIKITINAIFAKSALTFICNSDNASFGVYHFVAEAFSNDTTNLEYIVSDKNGQIKDKKEIILTDADVGPKLLCDKTLKLGDTIQLYGDNPNGFNQVVLDKFDEPQKIVTTTFYTGDSDGFSVSGNIMSLIDKTNFATLDSVPGVGSFGFLFASDPDNLVAPTKYHCNITDASGIHIPCTGTLSHTGLFACCKTLEKAPTKLSAMDLGLGCYIEMFYGCVALTTTPELLATTLADRCYLRMFAYCENLETAPSIIKADEFKTECCYQMFLECHNLQTAPTTIEANKLAGECCVGMFSGCSSLVTAPNLPSTELADECYYQMFRGCKTLKNVSDLPATTLKSHCYYEMFHECTALTKAPNIKAETLDTASCHYMFCDCSNLVVKKDFSSYRYNFFTCPEPEKNATYRMFYNTKGDFTSDDYLQPGQVCYCEQPA